VPRHLEVSIASNESPQFSSRLSFAASRLRVSPFSDRDHNRPVRSLTRRRGDTEVPGLCTAFLIVSAEARTPEHRDVASIHNALCRDLTLRRSRRALGVSEISFSQQSNRPEYGNGWLDLRCLPYELQTIVLVGGERRFEGGRGSGRNGACLFLAVVDFDE
jgi:hypothetical protein